MILKFFFGFDEFSVMRIGREYAVICLDSRIWAADCFRVLDEFSFEFVGI